MRSFSIVLAWFFACLVCCEGEVREGYFVMCRYRIFGKDVRMRSNNISFTGSTSSLDAVEQEDVQGQSLSKRRNGRQKPFSGKLGKKVKPTVSTIGLNVAYPMSANLQVPNFLKYPTSHYEVNLGASDRHFHPTAQLTSIYEAEMDTNDFHTTVHIGGEQFHQRLIEACYKAQADFLQTNPAVTTAEQLASAALIVMYNSRQLYALLCAAHRCQQCVNAQDEDNIYLATLLNQHTSAWINYDANTPDTLARLAATVVQANDINFRHGLTFSGIYSNAAWTNLWAQAYRCMRMPKGWFSWCENMFSNFHVVLEDGSENSPKIVALWPDGELLTLQNTTPPNLVVQQAFANYRTIDSQHDDMVTLENTNLNRLETQVTDAATTFAIAMTAFPQLDLVFRYLNCACSNDYNYTRDIESRTIRMSNRINDIKDLIYSSAVSTFVSLTSAGHCGTYDGYRLDNLTEDRPLYIRKSPDVKIITKLANSDFQRLSGACITYVDRAEITEADFALLNGHIAPISFNWWGRRFLDASHTTQAYYTPLINFSITMGYMQQMNNHYAGNPNINSLEHALDFLRVTQSMGAVLPRERCQLANSGTYTAAIMYLYGEGCIDNYYDYIYGTKDYFVPILHSGEFIDRYCDYLSLS